MAALRLHAVAGLGSLQELVATPGGQHLNTAWAPLRVAAASSTLQFPGLEYQSSEKMLRQGERHKLDLQKVANAFKTHEGDTGSSQVQVALLTAKIKYLSDHLLVHKKDFASRRGLKAMIARRKKLLLYLRSEEESGYRALISKLGIRELKKDDLKIFGSGGSSAACQRRAVSGKGQYGYEHFESLLRLCQHPRIQVHRFPRRLIRRWNWSISIQQA